MGDLLPRVHHDRVRSIHELVEMQFVEEAVGLLSISVKDEGFFSLERLVVSLDRVWNRRESW